MSKERRQSRKQQQDRQESDRPGWQVTIHCSACPPAKARASTLCPRGSHPANKEWPAAHAPRHQEQE